MPAKFALAIVGDGDITAANAAALLDNHVPETLSGVYTTERVTRGQKGLKTALSWFEEENLEVERVESVIEALREHQGKKEDVALVVLGTEGSEDLIAEAHDASMKVVDLTKAWYDVLPPEPEDKKLAELEAEEAAGEAAAGGTYGPPASARFTDAEVVALKKFAAFLLGGTDGGVVDNPPFDPPFTKTGGKAPATPAAANKERKEGTKPFFVTEDGDIRPARGRKRDVETKVYLTDDEFDAYVEANQG